MCVFWIVFLLIEPSWAEAWCYPSGLRVALESRPGRQDLGIATTVMGGSSLEGASEVGAAHVVEHLWFRSRLPDRPTVGAVLADLGADANAFTSQDEVMYLTVAHRRAIRGLLELEARRLTDVTGGIADDVIEMEKGVVLAELHQRYSVFQGGYADLLGSLHVLEPAYGRGIGGTPEDVSALEPDALRAFGRRIYRPSRTSIAIVGDFDAEAMIRLIEQSFPAALLADAGDSANTAPQVCPDRQLAAEPPSMSLGRTWTVHEADVDEAMVLFGWSLPPGRAWAQRGDALAWLVERHLESATPDWAICHVGSYAPMNVLTCVMPMEGADAEVTARVDRAVGKLEGFWRQLLEGSSRRHLILGSGMQMVSDQWRTSERVTWGRLSPSEGGYLAELGLHFAQTNRAALMLRARDPSVRDVVSEAAFYLDERRVRKRILRPVADPGIFGGERHGGRVADEAWTRDPDLVDAAYLERFIVLPDLSEIEVVRDEEGIDTWFWPMYGLVEPRVMVSLYDPWLQQDPTRAWVAHEMLRDPWEVAYAAMGGAVFRNGRTFSRSTANDAWTYEAHHGGMQWSVSSLGSLFTEMRRKMVKSKVWKGRWSVLVEQRAAQREDVHLRAAQARWERFAPDLPLGIWDAAVFAEAEALSRGEVEAFADGVIRPENATLLVVGPPPDEGDLAMWTHKAFRTWETSPRDSLPVATEEGLDFSPPDRTILVFPSDQARAQADITVACHTTEADPTSSWLLEKHIAGELNTRLRSERGLTYGVQAWSSEPIHGSTLFLQTQVDHASAGDTVAAIFAAFSEAGRGIDPGRLAQIKVEAARGTVGRYQTGDERMMLLQHLAMSDRGRGEEETGDRRSLAQRLADTTPESLGAELEDCVGHEVVTIIGDLSVVGDALDAASLSFEAMHPSASSDG